MGDSGACAAVGAAQPAGGRRTLGAKEEGKSLSIEKYNSFVLRYARRNITLHALDGLLFGTGMALVARQTVLPGFIHECVTRVEGLSGYENRFVGLLGTLMTLSIVLPHQLLVVKFAEARTFVKPLLMKVVVLDRLPWLGSAIAAAFVAPRSPAAALYMFLGCMFFLSFANGAVSPAWRETLAKTTPVRRRGLLFGIRDFLAGAFGAGALYAATRILTQSSMGFPANYAMLFFGMVVFSGLALIPLSLLKEAESPVEHRSRTLGDIMKGVREALWRDRLLWRYFACRWVLDMTTVANAGFFATKALKGLGGAEAVALTLKFAMVATVTRMAWGFAGATLADRFGFRSVFATSSVLSGAGIVVALFARTPMHFYAAYVLAVLGMRAMVLARINYILELAPPGKRPTYVTLDNMSRVPLIVAPLLGGWLADTYGYGVPFAAAAVLAAVSAVLFLFVAPEPRRERPSETVS